MRVEIYNNKNDLSARCVLYALACSTQRTQQYIISRGSTSKWIVTVKCENGGRYRRKDVVFCGGCRQESNVVLPRPKNNNNIFNSFGQNSPVLNELMDFSEILRARRIASTILDYFSLNEKMRISQLKITRGDQDGRDIFENKGTRSVFTQQFQFTSFDENLLARAVVHRTFPLCSKKLQNKRHIFNSSGLRVRDSRLFSGEKESHVDT